MPNPKVVDEDPITLSEVKDAVAKLEKRDNELNYRSNKAKEYLAAFTELSKSKKDELYKKLKDLNLVRLKEAHIVKIIDFLPKDVEDIKVILQAYPISFPKKDMDSIIKVVKEFA